MRFLLYRASRAFSVAHSTPALSLPSQVMVPLSVLESVREDAKAHAAREAQLKDALLNEVKERISDAKERINDAKERIKLLERVGANDLARALYERDVARGKVTARTLVEEAAAQTWRAWERLGVKERRQVSPSVMTTPFSTTEKLKVLLSFPGVAAYLQVVEEENGLAQGVLTKSAESMYPALCTPLHGRMAGARGGPLPVDVFTPVGENGRIAFAALVAFGGRNVGMYEPSGETVLVKLHVKPVHGLSATVKQIRGSAELPPVLASVELNVVDGAGPS
jgi:hypothetical protein